MRTSNTSKKMDSYAGRTGRKIAGLHDKTSIKGFGHLGKVDVFESVAADRGMARVHVADLVAVLAKSGVTRETLNAIAADLPAEDELDTSQFEHVVPVRAARDNFKTMVDRAQTHPTLLTKHNRPVAALVSADFYERAVAALEELADQAAVDRHEERERAGEVATFTSAQVDEMLNALDG